MSEDSRNFDLVIFDWAGTMVDFGCRAPIQALTEAFARRGVTLDEVTARADMGKAKADHVRALLARAKVASDWRAATGNAPGEADVAALMGDLGPLMRDAAARASELIPGAADAVAALRAAGLKIASSTGYTREMMQPVLARAEAQGYAPDHLVCADETPQGRPSPLMIYKACAELGVWPLSRVVKVDDSEAGHRGGPRGRLLHHRRRRLRQRRRALGGGAGGADLGRPRGAHLGGVKAVEGRRSRRGDRNRARPAGILSCHIGVLHEDRARLRNPHRHPRGAASRAGRARKAPMSTAAVRAQIDANDRAVGRAIGTRDFAALEKLWASGMIVNSPGNNILTRDQVFASIRSDQLAYSSVKTTTDALTVSKDVAVAMGHEDIVMSNGPMAGKPLIRRFTDVWQKSGEGWVQIARQATYVGIDGGAVYGHPDPALTH